MGMNIARNTPNWSFPYVLQQFVENFRRFLPLLCKDGDFFRRGKSREVELGLEWIGRMWWSVPMPSGHATLPHPHSLFGNAPHYKGEEKTMVAPDFVNE